MKLAATYKKQGVDASAALKRAYAEIDKSQYALGENAEKTAKKFGISWKGAGAALKNGLVTAAKVGAAAIGAVSAAVTAAGAGLASLSRAAVESYADYEQLVGGVETLFGASAKAVQGYADEAYRTAGLSANAYMETVTSFSASLLQGLGGDTAAAAEVAHQAIVDMSDNANKMGSDITMIQNAYQGFAKQNYTINNLMSAA